MDEKYSFSRVDAFRDCGQAWYNKYILKEKGISNAFAEHGTLVHNVLEKYARKDIGVDDMFEEFITRFDNEVTSVYPRFSRKLDLREHYKIKFGKFLDSFKGLGGDVAGIEQYFEYDLKGRTFRGFIDVITETDEYINVVDYKTGNKFTKAEMVTKKDQLLLYYPAVKEMFKDSDKEIRLFFHFIKENKAVEVKYTPELVEETLVNFRNLITSIEASTEYTYGLTEENKKKMGFFCNNICSYRLGCSKRKELLGDIKQEQDVYDEEDFEVMLNADSISGSNNNS